MIAHAAKTLTVYAPDYFVSEWGPGPKIEEAFEKICGCDLKYISGDPLSRLMLEGKNSKADILIGLNSDSMLKARKSDLLAPHNIVEPMPQLPIEWKDNMFLPFNWSYVSFVFDNTKIAKPPKTFVELASDKQDYKIVIQDPRSSPAGLALILWIKTIYGDQAPEIWSKLSPKILTVTKGWSEAYGMFTAGEAEMVLSFSTSPAYHQVVENDNSKSALIFDDGHYIYLELAAKVKGSQNSDLADQFMAFILSPDFQSIIPLTNWSYPVKLKREVWPSAFLDLPNPSKSIFLNEVEASELAPIAIDEWLSAMSK
jgi:thiamine transport system substrate-binding protein